MKKLRGTEFHPAISIIFLIVVCSLFCYAAYAAVVYVDHYKKHEPFRDYPIAGYTDIRDAVVLTNSYVDTNVVRMADYNNIGIALDITQGSLTSVEYKIFWSKDGTNWYQEVTESVAAGVITHVPAYYTVALTGDTAFYAIVPFYANYFKMQVKGTGTVTGSLCQIAVFGSY
jgi:hypothetical protein